MMKRIMASVVALLLISGVGLARPHKARGLPRNFCANLDQSQEVPPTGDQGTGRVRLKVVYANGTAVAINYQAKIDNGVQWRQLHFHCAPAGANGSVAAFMGGRHDGGVDSSWLLAGTLSDAAISSTGTGITNPITCSDANGNPAATVATINELVQQIIQGNVYICAHNANNPGGAIRDQVHPCTFDDGFFSLSQTNDN